MTHVPPSSETPQMMGQDPSDEAPAPAFRPFLPEEESPKHSRWPLVVLGLSVVLVIGGLVYRSTRPAEAKAQTPVQDVGSMTSDELAKNASAAAARELVRRMLDGTPAEQAAVSSLMTHPQSPRLARNLAMAMALAQQKRASQMRLQVERNIQMVERGY